MNNAEDYEYEIAGQAPTANNRLAHLGRFAFVLSLGVGFFIGYNFLVFLSWFKS